MYFPKILLYLEDFVNFDDTIAATETVLSHELIISMTYNSKIQEAVQSDEENVDGTIRANHKCLEKPTPRVIRSAIETIINLSFSAESKEMQGCTIIVSRMVENRLATNMKQASLKDLSGKNFKRNMIDDKQSNIYIFFSSYPISFPLVMGPF